MNEQPECRLSSIGTVSGDLILKPCDAVWAYGVTLCYKLYSKTVQRTAVYKESGSMVHSVLEFTHYFGIFQITIQNVLSFAECDLGECYSILGFPKHHLFYSKTVQKTAFCKES